MGKGSQGLRRSGRQRGASARARGGKATSTLVSVPLRTQESRDRGTEENVHTGLSSDLPNPPGFSALFPSVWIDPIPLFFLSHS